MSGSSKYDRGGSDRTDCRFNETTHIVSPDAQVLSTVAKGNLLEIVVVNNRVAVLAKAGELGGLAFQDVLRLKQCIDKGNDYVAEVLKISGGLCEVQVRNK